MGMGYDNNGNTFTKVVGSNTTSYAWDFENRLSSVTLPGSGGTVSFKYDPVGRRIYKSSSSGTSIFAYDGDNLVEETNSSGTAVARYSQGLNIDEPLAMLRSSATSYHQADGLGTITSLANTAGLLAETHTFDSFGNRTASSGSLTNPFQYTARENDPETGLYYYRARYYDWSVGRFLSQDPVGFYAGANFYAYVGNSAISLIDPLGLCPCPDNNHPRGNHPFYPRTGGFLVGATGEAGLGSIGGSAVSGNFGFGESGSHMGGVASGAVATNAGGYAGGAPHQDPKTTGVYGAFIGGGASLFVSNGQPCDLQGPFKTLNFNLGLGFISFSGSLAFGENNVYQLTFSPVGWGLGASVSANTTNTKVTPCCK